MYLSISKVVAAFMAFNVVTADLHDSCACRNGDSEIARITTLACTVYNDAGYEWGSATYDEGTGRCVQTTADDQIAGDQWEAACQQIATAGFACVDGEGTCYANPDDVQGSC